MEEKIKHEIKNLSANIPKDLFLNLIRELYFQTSWELIKNLIENENLDPEILFKQQLEISKKTGIQGANALKPFKFSGKPLEQVVKKFIFAAFNMGVKTEFKFLNDDECEIVFKRNCGHGVKIKQYNLPFICNKWCEVHFNAEINELNPDYEIKFVEGMPQNKSYCKFLISKKDSKKSSNK
ncbi:MAG: hypothetical protein ACTSRP_01355 [Candidatus Helarchaeota archaeon]